MCVDIGAAVMVGYRHLFEAKVLSEGIVYYSYRIKIRTRRDDLLDLKKKNAKLWRRKTNGDASGSILFSFIAAAVMFDQL